MDISLVRNRRGVERGCGNRTLYGYQVDDLAKKSVAIRKKKTIKGDEGKDDEEC